MGQGDRYGFLLLTVMWVRHLSSKAVVLKGCSLWSLLLLSCLYLPVAHIYSLGLASPICDGSIIVVG